MALPSYLSWAAAAAFRMIVPKTVAAARLIELSGLDLRQPSWSELVNDQEPWNDGNSANDCQDEEQSDK